MLVSPVEGNFNQQKSLELSLIATFPFDYVIANKDFDIT